MVKTRSRRLAERGEKIYSSFLKRQLEPKHVGKFVAIEVDSGDYFVGSSILDATDKARKKYERRVFYIKRIGYQFVHSFKNSFRN